MSGKPSKFYYVVNDKAVNKVLELPSSELPCGAKLVLLKLLSYVGKFNYSWPSQETIGKATGIGERQVRNHLTKLIELELIRKTRKGYKVPKSDGGYYTKSNGYDLSKLTITKEKKTKGNKLPIEPEVQTNKPTGKEVPTIRLNEL